MSSLREQIGKHILYRKKKGGERTRQVHNFETAKSAVILFDAGEQESFQAIKEFRNYIQNKGLRCAAFGFVSQKEIPEEMLFWKNYSFITRKDLTWYLKPKGEATEAFYAEDPDILIDFTGGGSLEIQYLVQLSSARFKIGCYTEEENDYDLMINLTGRKDAAYLAEQVTHYVNMLTPSKQQGA